MQYEIRKKKIFYVKAKYKPNENIKETLKILFEKFISKNKNKCKIIYKNKIYEIKEYFEDIDIKYNYKDSIKFKLIFIHNIIAMSYMFYNCHSLISLSFNKETNKNISPLQIYIINIQRIFYGCESLKLLSDISKLDTSNINNMSYLFYWCKSFVSLPDISKWNTSKVKDMQYMFYGCESLISLPDISKWNIINVIILNSMFGKCKSLISLPNISKWNISNVINMKNLFSECTSLLELPNFYILNLLKNNIAFELKYKIDSSNKRKVKILGKKFLEKNKYKGVIIFNKQEFELTEIFEKFDNNNDILRIILVLNKNIDNMSDLFYQCKSLISIEYFKRNNLSYNKNTEFNNIFDDSEFNNFNINEKQKKNDSISFYEDSLNNKISYISNKNNTNFLSENENIKMFSPLSIFRLTDIYLQLSLNKMSHMFYGCNSLISLPDISKWNTANVKNMSSIFYECNSLKSLPDISQWDTSNVKNMSSMFY